jgi:hypothetical protein
MKFSNESAATAYRVLNKCAQEMESAGAWRLRCAMQNGMRLNIAAAMEEGFLQLVCHPDAIRKSALALEDAMLCNKTLAGGVKLAMNSSNSGFHLRTDIVIAEERQLLDRLEWALEGFHDGNRLLLSSEVLDKPTRPQTAPDADLDERLRESSWLCTKRGPNNYSVELDAQAAPPAVIRINESNLDLSVELLRCGAPSDASRHALALFLLTATSALRMVRAYAAQAEDQECFGLQVSLRSSAAAAADEHVPVVMFWDEVDAIGGSRGESANRIDDRMLNAFMAELDGLEERGNIVILSATNRSDALDPALMRSGRLGDLVLHFPQPNSKAAPDSVVRVDWDTITFKLRGKHNWPAYRVFDMTPGSPATGFRRWDGSSIVPPEGQKERGGGPGKPCAPGYRFFKSVKLNAAGLPPK